MAERCVFPYVTLSFFVMSESVVKTAPVAISTSVAMGKSQRSGFHHEWESTIFEQRISVMQRKCSGRITTVWSPENEQEKRRGASQYERISVAHGFLPPLFQDNY